MIIVIRAGGSGTRLWPVSHTDAPKQFLPLLGPTSLLRLKYEEYRPLVRSSRHLFVTLSAPFVRRARKILPELPASQFIAEPVARNTGPGIALESMIIERSPETGKNPVIASLTVDDIVRRKAAFATILRASERFLKQHPFTVVTIGSKSRRKDPGISYIDPGRMIAKVNGQAFRRVKRWVEKPSGALLTRLFNDPSVTGHTGMYVWRASTITNLFRHYQPWYTKLETIPGYQGPLMQRALRRVFPTIPSMSVEEAVTSHANDLAVVGDALGWSDTGKWNLIYDILAAREGENILRGNVHAFDTHGSLVFGSGMKPVGILGLKGIVVVDTPNGLLVCSKEAAPDVKKIVTALSDKPRRRTKR